MTKCVFIANGKKFTTYAEARKVSRYVDTEYIENWKDPVEIEASAKIAEAHRKAVEHLNTPELCKLRLAKMRG